MPMPTLCATYSEPYLAVAEHALTPRELASIEERARSVGCTNYVQMDTVFTLAREDVPALLAEVRRLRARDAAA